MNASMNPDQLKQLAQELRSDLNDKLEPRSMHNLAGLGSIIPESALPIIHAALEKAVDEYKGENEGLRATFTEWQKQDSELRQIIGCPKDCDHMNALECLKAFVRQQLREPWTESYVLDLFEKSNGRFAKVIKDAHNASIGADRKEGGE